MRVKFSILKLELFSGSSPEMGITTQFTMTEEEKEADRRPTPIHRLGYPEDMVEAIIVLCSDKRARFLQGVTLDVAGGRSCPKREVKLLQTL